MLQHLHAEHQGISVELEFDEYVYRPGRLTQLFADIIDVAPGDRVVDVGCGTGYLGIVASLLGAGQVYCTDPEPTAIKWAIHNARINNVPNVVALRGGSLDPVEGLEIDLILASPPQMPYTTNFNPWRFGGPDGTDIILKIIHQSSLVLKKETGRLFLLHTGLANPSRVREAMASQGFAWRTVTSEERELDEKDLDGLEPGLRGYIMELARKGITELTQRDSKWYYLIWFDRAVLH